MFSDEEIDGESYFGLTESIMTNQLKLKAGQMIKIKQNLQLFDVVSSTVCMCLFILIDLLT